MTVRKKLMDAPFDCIVLMYSRAVKASDGIAAWMITTAERQQSDEPTSRHKKLDQKSQGLRIYAAICIRAAQCPTHSDAAVVFHEDSGQLQSSLASPVH